MEQTSRLPNHDTTSEFSSSRKKSKAWKDFTQLFQKKSSTLNKEQTYKSKNVSKDLTPSQLSEIREASITCLPQEFQVYVLGIRPCRNVKGIDTLREPIREMMSRFNDDNHRNEVATARVTISYSGINERSTSSNNPAFLSCADEQQASCSLQSSSLEDTDSLSISQNFDIQNISYGTQDLRHNPSVFSFIIVHYFSNPVVVAECHAYLCQNPLEARYMALSLKLAYQGFEDQLNYMETGDLKIGAGAAAGDLSKPSAVYEDIDV